MVQVKERPASGPPAVPESQVSSAALDRRDQLAFGVMMLVGWFLRIHELGTRAYHHDESLHATYSWYLFSGRGYVHDPLMHGPEQFSVNAFLFFLFGDSDFTGRLQYVLLGTIMIGLPYFLRREMGRWGALVAGGLLLISPGYLYFSRFAREDMPFAFFTMIMALGLIGYLRASTPRHLYLFSVGLALAFATKEATYITGFIWTVFVLFMLAIQRLDADGQHVWRSLRSLTPGVIGRCGLIFLAIYAVLFTTFFTNLGNPWECLRGQPCVQGGLYSGSWGALKYWLDQHDVQRGGQPWFYYLLLLSLYEFIPAALAVIAAVRGRLTLFAKFCLFWAGGALAMYSWAGEKMPWLILHLTLPLILAGSPALGDWLERLDLPTLRSRTTLGALGLWLLIAATAVGFLAVNAVTWLNVIDDQALGLERLALVLIIAGAAAGLIYVARRHGSRLIGLTFSLATLIVGLFFYIHTSWMVTYAHGDVPLDMLIYVQSSPDVVWVTRELERIGQQTGQGKDLRILMDNGYTEQVGGQAVVHEAVSWPFEWYLRGFKNRRYYSRTVGPDINLRDYPAILVMAPNLEPLRPALGDYTGQKYKLNWWFPEDYKGLSPSVIAEALSDPMQRGRLLKFLLYREPLNTLGAREFYLFVRKDIPGLGPGPLAASPLAPGPAPSGSLASTAGTALTLARIGVDPAGQSQLSEPKDLALGPDGRVYVTEARANRVTVFNREGSLATRWGAAGTGDGEFNEPWGIAVAPDGEVYVADTWNHRVQRFDASGRFLGKWGILGDTQGQVGVGPGQFWGPRDIAIGADGRVYVTDTGNKRIQVFDRAGTFLAAIGGEGPAPGRLREPVGLTWAGDSLWVADAWNNRVQQLGPDGQPISALPVSGWESQAITNKPYLAVSSSGKIIATAPDAGLVLVLDGSSEVRVVSLDSGLRGAAQPTGVATAPTGEVYVADSRNGVVLRLATLD